MAFKFSMKQQFIFAFKTHHFQHLVAHDAEVRPTTSMRCRVMVSLLLEGSKGARAASQRQAWQYVVTIEKMCGKFIGIVFAPTRVRLANVRRLVDHLHILLSASMGTESEDAVCRAKVAFVRVRNAFLKFSRLVCKYNSTILFLC